MKKMIIPVIFMCLIVSACGNNKNDASGNSAGLTVTAGMGHDNTKICWGFRKMKNSAPEVPQSTADLLKRYDSYYIGDSGKKELFLTFDEGYENGYTPKILDVLKKTDTPAAFFVTGQYIKEQPELVKRMAQEGHIVGNHSVHHPSFPEVSDQKLKEEITGLNDMYNKLTGQNMTYLRPPKGEFSERTLAISKELGYKNIFWSSAYVDWDTNKQLGVQNAVSKVTSQYHNGNIILLHAVSKDNADGLETMINEAKAMGYTFKSLDGLR